MPADHYVTLGISRNADESEIKKAYRKAAMKYHPDKNPDNKERAAAKFKEVGGAYACLSDPEKKAFYDRWGQEENSGGGGGGRQRSTGDPTMDEFVNMFFGFGGGRQQQQRSRQSGGEQQGQNTPAPAGALLMQFLPILLLAFLSLWSGGSNFGSTESPFTFGRNSMYRYQMETQSGISYFVTPETKQSIARDFGARNDLEHRVEQSWRRRLHTDCQFQQKQKHQMQKNAQSLNDEDKMQKAREFPLHSCDELRQRYNEQGGQEHRRRI